MKTKLELNTRYRIQGTNKYIEYTITTKEEIEKFKNYLFLETDCISYNIIKVSQEEFEKFRGEFDLLNELGYNMYKIIIEEV